MRTFFKSILLIAAAAVLVSCGPASMGPIDPYENREHPWGVAWYSWGFVNIDGPPFDMVSLFRIENGNGVFTSAAGWLWPAGVEGRAKTSKENKPIRIPDSVIVKWMTPDKQKHQQEVNLVGLVPDPEHFDGTVWLRYLDGRWQPYAMSIQEEKQRAIEKKPGAPIERELYSQPYTRGVIGDQRAWW